LFFLQHTVVYMLSLLALLSSELWLFYFKNLKNYETADKDVIYINTNI